MKLFNFLINKVNRKTFQLFDKKKNQSYNFQKKSSSRKIDPASAEAEQGAEKKDKKFVNVFSEKDGKVVKDKKKKKAKGKFKQTYLQVVLGIWIHSFSASLTRILFVKIR